jgi:hypothetical protein
MEDLGFVIHFLTDDQNQRCGIKVGGSSIHVSNHLSKARPTV